MNAYDLVSLESDKLKKTNDCGVKALAIAANIDYQKAHDMLEARGRKNNRGTPMPALFNSLDTLGVRYEYYKGRDCPTPNKGKYYTPNKFADTFKYGTYFCRTYSHIFIVQNGEVLDWTKGRKHRIREIIKVIV